MRGGFFSVILSESQSPKVASSLSTGHPPVANQDQSLIMSQISGGHNLTQKHMKTTALGILTIVATLSNVGIQVLKGGAPDLMSAFAAVTAGIGLIKARDNK